MSFVVEPHIEEYAVAASTPHPLDDLFERLAAETRERTTAPQMMVGPLEGRFLELLVRLTRARRGMRVVAIPNRHFPPGDEALAAADVVLGSLAQLTPEVVEP